MTKLTKLALEQINSALATENAALRKQVADLGILLEIKRDVRSMATPAPVRVKPPMPQWQIDRAETMAKAKALAMAGHCMVRV